MMRSVASLLIVLAGSTSWTGHAQAQAPADYPRKPIRIVVPFTPGGPVDIVARSVAPKMTEALGQQVIIDNRAGAGSTLGTELVAKSAPDGYTILMVSGSFVMNPAMVTKLPYDSSKDFAYISVMAEVPSAIAIHPVLPVKTVRQFVALAKQRPGELNYSSPGRGTLGHLAAELFSSMTGVKMTHVAYKGAAPALVDLISGQVQMLIAALPGFSQLTRDGKIRILAQTGSRRSASMPEVPTVIESGYPGFIVASQFGLMAPGGTPRPIVDRVRSALLAALDDPTVAKRLAELGAERVGSTPEEHEAISKAEIAKWLKVTREAGIQPQ